MLQKDNQNNMAFQTMQGMYRLIRLVEGATNLVSALLRVSRKILYSQPGSIAQILVNKVRVNGPRSWYGEEEVEGLPGVPMFVIEHLPHLGIMHADVDSAGATISREKSDWWWNRVKMVRFVYGEAGRWPQASKVDKVWNWP